MIAWYVATWWCGKAVKNTTLCRCLSTPFAGVLKANNVPEGVSCVVTGDYTLGQKLSSDTRIPLVSATGSTRMGKAVSAAVAARLGRSLLNWVETMLLLLPHLQIFHWFYQQRFWRCG